MELRESKQEDIDVCIHDGISGGNFKQDVNDAKAFSLLKDKTLLGMGGYLKITETTAWFWVELTHEARHHIIAVYRTCRSFLDRLAEENGIIRMQAWIEVGYEERIRFAEHLGFEREGDMLHDFAGKGRPAYIYVKYLQES